MINASLKENILFGKTGSGKERGMGEWVEWEGDCVCGQVRRGET